MTPSDDSCDVAQWRRHLHAHPELAFEENASADFVVEQLRSFGITSIHRGLATTGVVASLKGRYPGAGSIGLRADMDALPVQEENAFDHRSRHPGKMHACGHDGHTAMLLGAARDLARDPDFAGTVHFIFQPAEEGGGGGKRMVEHGLFDLFPCDSVYALHNWPGLPAGHFAVKPGPIMASADRFDLVVNGKGGHAAMPHRCIDPVPAAAQIVTALQTLVSRRLDPLHTAVLSVTQFHAGDAYNVIPEHAVLRGTLRTFDDGVRETFMARIASLAAQLAAAHGCTAEVSWKEGYCATVNHPAQASKAAQAAASVVGADKVNPACEPSMASEDFSYMLRARPGAYLFIGNGPGESGCTLHNPHYDFNDAILPTGIAFWRALVKQELS